VADPVLLITGASKGIGAATARAAAGAGYRVALLARSADALQELAAELGGPERALALACDVADWDAQAAAVAATLDAFGRLDAAFANAGSGASRGFLAESVDHWRDMVLANVLGAALTISATIPALKETRGHLLVTGSVAGHKPTPGSLYSATKAAARSMAEAARLELHGSGVRVTVVSPGTVDTPFYDEPPGNEPLLADDVAEAVLFALSRPPRVNVNEILVRPTTQEF
jgi:NADP-dependent 3-hydroxy acid dehydrogenase YdfG